MTRAKTDRSCNRYKLIRIFWNRRGFWEADVRDEYNPGIGYMQLGFYDYTRRGVINTLRRKYGISVPHRFY